MGERMLLYRSSYFTTMFARIVRGIGFQRQRAVARSSMLRCREKENYSFDLLSIIQQAKY